MFPGSNVTWKEVRTENPPTPPSSILALQYLMYFSELGIFYTKGRINGSEGDILASEKTEALVY